ncbi:MAG TPA: Wzz/FepE/Etk N-terminal domain-containing protein [Candidatus Acidoferrales bacterium]|nr:Wzz/FepE/Etk N-terminal domain-containing protein [Candidatus Acidoferrales bacterium]
MKTTNYDQDYEPQAMAPGDIYFILFRHKWKIIVLSLAGIVATAAYWWYYPPPFQSEAKLLIRYVLDNRSINANSKNAQMSSPDNMGQSIVNSEMEILTSYDLAQEAAKDIGPEKILAKYGGGNDPTKAAEVIKKNLVVESPKQDSVIHVVYTSADPMMVQPVLSEVINDYLDKHVQVHESSMSDDYLSQETAQLRSQIDETESELRAAKDAAGIISVPDAEKSYTDQIGWIRNQLFQTQADLAAQLGAKKAQPQQETTAPAAPVIVMNVPGQREDEYQRVCARLEYLQSRENEYYTKFGYTDENRLVQETQLEIAQTQILKKNLETSYPDLAGTYVSSSSTGEMASSSSGTATYSENLQPASLQARIPVLKQELAELQSDAIKVDDAESKITDLQRKKQMLEDNYQNFAASLEQARIDETLGPGRVSNISAVEAPTPPFKEMSKQIKAMLFMIGGGIAAGLAWAFLVEFYFDTSVRRTKEIESRLKLPLLISIPDISRNGYRRLVQAAERRQLQFQNGDGESEGGSGIVSWETSSCLNPFYDALRDRLVKHFGNSDGALQPKLVSVTGTEKGCGVSAIAAGVATSLAETGERVLLVDMKLEHGVAQQFFLGRQCCGLDEALALETRDAALVQENLYVVSAGSPDERFQRILPRLFVSLLPRIKASDYSYIIFDMPPVSQTSITSRLAGFMDMVLLVIQSEKTNRDTAQQAVDLLIPSQTKIGIVLNKMRKYIPERLHRETLIDF